MKKLIVAAVVSSITACWGQGMLSPSLNALVDGTLSVQGTPVVNMWKAPYPQRYVPHTGFPTLDRATHTLIYQPQPVSGNEGWGYSHHSQLIYHKGRFAALWSSNWHGEDAPGQRVLFSSSPDALEWSDPVEIFPSPDEVKEWEASGFYMCPIGLRVLDGVLYACAALYEDVGWENAECTEVVAIRDQDHVFRKRKFHDIIVRVVGDDDSFGPFFAIGEKSAPVGVKYDIVSYKDVSSKEVADVLWEKLDRALCRPALTAVDKARLSEPTSYQAPGGEMVCLFRDDFYSHRMYVCHSDDDGKSWSVPQPTNIPDAPSLARTLALDDGTVLLIGNQNAALENIDEPVPPHLGRDPLTVAVAENGYEFTRAYALRSGKQKQLIPNVHGRGKTGGQYPSAVVHDGTLYVLYSMGKEAIWISQVPLSDLGIEVVNSNEGENDELDENHADDGNGVWWRFWR